MAMDFFEQRRGMAQRNFSDPSCRDAVRQWHDASRRFDYQYMFEWLGRPIIQDPQDICAIQELIWRVQPDLVVETGIAHGGSLVLSASILAAISQGELLAGRAAKPRRVVGIDIDIRAHNRAAIEAHPMAHRIDMLQGSSIAPEIIAEVHARAAKYQRVLVFLDSNHTHEHVLAELEAYAPLASEGSYCVVFDTVIEDLPAGMYPDRPWDVGNNPKTAVHEFLSRNKNFVVDEDMDAKLLISVAPGGYLRRIKA